MTGDSIYQIINRAMRLYREGRLMEAYDRVTENEDVKAGNPAQMVNFRYSIASRLGKVDLAIELMREAIIDKGYWYGYEYLLEDDDLQPLREFSEFQKLADLCREREIEAKRTSRASMKILTTNGSKPKRPKLLVALHGNGDNIEISEPYWLPCLRQGYHLALPQSSQISYWGAFTWADLDLGLSELIEHLTSVQGSLGVGPSETVLAGFSGGARLALKAVLDGKATPSALILVAPWLPELDSWEEATRTIPKRGIKVWIFCGDQDEDCLEGSKKLDSLLETNRADVHLEIIEDLDHDFPADFEERLSRPLKNLKHRT